MGVRTGEERTVRDAAWDVDWHVQWTCAGWVCKPECDRRDDSGEERECMSIVEFRWSMAGVGSVLAPWNWFRRRQWWCYIVDLYRQSSTEEEAGACDGAHRYVLVGGGMYFHKERVGDACTRWESCSSVTRGMADGPGGSDQFAEFAGSVHRMWTRLCFGRGNRQSHD